MQHEHQNEQAIFKPTVEIKNCTIMEGWDGKKRLFGTVIDYPDEHQGFPGAVTNGKQVITSPIVKTSADYVETQRTVYLVQSWLQNGDEE